MLQNSNPIKKCQDKFSSCYGQSQQKVSKPQAQQYEQKIESKQKVWQKNIKESNINIPDHKNNSKQNQQLIQSKNVEASHLKEEKNQTEAIDHENAQNNLKVIKQHNNNKESQFSIINMNEEAMENNDGSISGNKHNNFQRQINKKIDKNFQQKILTKFKNNKLGQKQKVDSAEMKHGHMFRAGDVIVNSKKNMYLFSEYRLYKAKQLIGTGTFGQVLSVISQVPNTGSIYTMAMKIIKKQPAYINQGLIQIKNLREIVKFEQLTHGDRNNYLKIYDAFMWEGYLCIAMELLDNSILNILESSLYKGLQMKWLEKWGKQILFNLAKIHKIGIIHCDIKPQNIMFRPQQPEKPLLIDFSSSCTHGSQIFTYIQSRFYRSPQVLISFKPYTQKIDIWSLGCLLAQMYLGLPLFPGGCAYDQIAKIYKLVGSSFQNSQISMIRNSEYGKRFFQIKEISQQKRIKQIQQKHNQQNVSIRLKHQQLYQKRVLYNEDYYNLEQFQDMIKVRNPPPKDLQTHQLFIDLIKQMLVFNPEQRISAEEAFLHPFIGGIFSQLEQLRNLEDILEQSKTKSNLKQ